MAVVDPGDVVEIGVLQEGEAVARVCEQVGYLPRRKGGGRLVGEQMLTWRTCRSLEEQR